MEKYYTYIYYDPSRNNEPIYVGKGSGRRAWDHIRSARMGNKRHPFLDRLRFMSKNSIEPNIGLYSGFEEELALLVEEELISKFGRKDLGKGSLLNLTDGGDSPPKSKKGKFMPVPSAETRKAWSESRKGNQNRRGTKDSPETIEKKRQNSLGNKSRTGLTAPNKGIPRKDEIREKLSVALKGKPWTQARRDAQNKKKGIV